ncbi:MAG: hypothetical protein H6704_17115 [Myxococcales bacterium]|nr:hypothetical protein [Myxococcales bacterium]
MTALLALALLAPRYDGIALTPYYENPAEGLTFDGMVDHAAGTGAEVLSVVVSWAQPDVRASHIAPDPKETQDDGSVRRIIRRARGRGLRVVVFPILWVEARDVGEWRGTLRPDDEDAWWRSYRAFVLHYARLAAEERADVFSVGSELASLEDRVDRWRALIADVRAVYPGELMYSANWDHYADVPFWRDLDLVGLTAYHRLTEGLDPTVDELVAAWQPIKARLLGFAARVGRPMVFTELGYPATDGAARSPWDYTGNRTIDFEEQRRCFEAFRRVWGAESALAGVLFWNWWGPGHDDAGWYNPRGKPAEAEVRAWFEGRAGRVGARIGPATYR